MKNVQANFGCFDSCRDFSDMKLLLQPLRWYCVECVIHHERDVREE